MRLTIESYNKLKDLTKGVSISEPSIQNKMLELIVEIKSIESPQERRILWGSEVDKVLRILSDLTKLPTDGGTFDAVNASSLNYICDMVELVQKTKGSPYNEHGAVIPNSGVDYILTALNLGDKQFKLPVQSLAVLVKSDADEELLSKAISSLKLGESIDSAGEDDDLVNETSKIIGRLKYQEDIMDTESSPISRLFVEMILHPQRSIEESCYTSSLNKANRLNTLNLDMPMPTSFSVPPVLVKYSHNDIYDSVGAYSESLINKPKLNNSTPPISWEDMKNVSDTLEIIVGSERAKQLLNQLYSKYEDLTDSERLEAVTSSSVSVLEEISIFGNKDK